MGFVMWSRMLILCVIPITVTSITISSNGNSPEIKIVGGTMVDLQKGFIPSQLKADDNTIKKNIDKTKIQRGNSTKLAINERYRRLIPYMTFYYANDLVAPTREAYNTKSVEVEKAHIIEADTIDTQNHLRPKTYYQNKIPRYQGNRLTHFNIASANPTKIFYNKGYPVVLQNVPKVSTKYNPLLLEYDTRENFHRDYNRYIPKEFKAPSVSYTSTREPYLNFYQNEESDNFDYYLHEKEQVKYKLVPYENTPPVKNVPQIEFNNTPKKYYNIAASVPNDPVYIKARPRPQYNSDEVVFQQSKYRKPPTTISENYYEQQIPVHAQPILESGFKPIISHTTETVNTPAYTSTLANPPYPHYQTEKAQELQIESAPIAPQNEDEPEYYQYDVEQPTYKPQPVSSDAITLADLLNSLQLNKFIPKPITKENVGSSIRILIQALNMLKGKLQQSEVEPPVLSSPAPFEAPKVSVTTKKPILYTTTDPAAEANLNADSYLAKVENPSQHLDDYTSTSQRFPLPITSDEEGGTPGRPDIDYPILTTIPQTKFNCKTQRYKGFFADPDTRCQVWHYCDLNGGQASFLCPNGTIFSQAGLTCDWWFNVKCSSTAQLYVLNESLYKYILPHSPKFPEDYSGPLVDKYLTLKFKEMEEEFKKNKNKNKTSSENKDSDEDKGNDDSKKDLVNTDEEKDRGVKNNVNNVSESSVIVATSGASGNVERLGE
ncbi:unnamed protein product [Parnassius mnemosyne]|uniref:Chitin-binding type-2 domain-containing protein n=2 Tax=Parnassius mnemosyne TaxID=213953 RepID=A0AAV1KBS0_9NEOP